jgi:hypothetical protein
VLLSVDFEIAGLWDAGAIVTDLSDLLLEACAQMGSGAGLGSKRSGGFPFVDLEEILGRCCCPGTWVASMCLQQFSLTPCFLEISKKKTQKKEKIEKKGYKKQNKTNQNTWQANTLS